MAENSAAIAVPTHPGEPVSNQARGQLTHVEPKAMRTFTPSLAVISHSSGGYHWTSEGRKLADFTSGVLVANLGHHPARWWQRVWMYMQLTPGQKPAEDTSGKPGQFLSAVPLTAYNAVTELELLACQRLLANLRGQPGGQRCEHVVWAASGSEAVQKALWAALGRRPAQDLILATRYGFHGKKGLAGAATGSERDRERDPRVRFISFPMHDCRNLAARREPLDLTEYRKELERTWMQFGDKICCLITGPYLGGGGSFHPQPEYLQMLEQFCREHDIIFILDEIQANFGRTGPMYAFTQYGVTPDIVCLGKGLGNGVPVSAAVGRADLFAAMQYGEASDTWSANPFSCAAVLATLDEFEQHDVIGQGRKLSAVLETGLLRLTELPAIANIRGEGTVWGIECRDVGAKPATDVAAEIVRRCYLGDERGRAIHLLGALAGKVIRVSPPLTFDLREAQDYLDAMYGIVGQIRD